MTTVEELCSDNRKLVDENLKLRKENKELRDNYEQYKAVVEPEIERLEKENAELKKSIKYVNTICERKSVTNSQLTELAADSSAKLCEAKELVKHLLTSCRNYPESNLEWIKKAEAFLKEC